MKTFDSNEPFITESGSVLPAISIAYETYGELNAAGDNVIWICHALTASADAADWWPGMIGKCCAFDSSKHFIVCANILGSCYGSTGPLSINAQTGEPWFYDFPLLTIRDMVKAHQLLADHLGIHRIALLAGGSMGGYQALEWAASSPNFIDKLFLIATAARETPWGIAIHTAQRLAIEADGTWGKKHPDAGVAGLKAARGFGLITYRRYERYLQTQADEDAGKLENFRASSYIHYQGEKLVKRFNAFSYHLLTRAMDTHNLARGRGESLTDVLQHLQQKTMIVSIASDMLCPPAEQELLAKNIPAAELITIDSDYGHDGFLVETEKITEAIHHWLNKI
ncbi:MAG: homoserine O-acetyltransferase MetX [Flavisolibacter sp.]